MISPISKLFKLTAKQVAEHEARIMKDAINQMATQVRVNPTVQSKVADKNTGQFVFEDYFNVEPYIKASTGRLDPLLDTAVNNPVNIEKEILNAMRTGRVDGKKLSSQQRRNIAQTTQQATDEMEGMLDLQGPVIWNSSYTKSPDISLLGRNPMQHDMLTHIPANAEEEYFKELVIKNMVEGKNPISQLKLYGNRPQAVRLAQLREDVGLPSMNVDFEGLDLPEQIQFLEDKMGAYEALREALRRMSDQEIRNMLRKKGRKDYGFEAMDTIRKFHESIFDTWKESGAADFKGSAQDLVDLTALRSKLRGDIL